MKRDRTRDDAHIGERVIPRLFSCKCGKTMKDGTLAPISCVSCPECGTNLALDERDCKAPAPHIWRDLDGKQVCRKCGTPKPEEAKS